MEQAQTVEINGKQAQVLVADLHEGQQLAVVDQSVLKRLIELLPTEEFYRTRRRMADKIIKSQNVQEMCDLMIEELQFHKSVNIIDTFFAPKEEQFAKVTPVDTLDK